MFFDRPLTKKQQEELLELKNLLSDSSYRILRTVCNNITCDVFQINDLTQDDRVLDKRVQQYRDQILWQFLNVIK